MASYNEEFIQYRIFLENIAKSVTPQDSEVTLKAQHLRNRLVCCHSDAEGEIIYWILKFLDEKKCPTKLISPIVRNVLVEIRNDPRYKDPNTEAFADLRGLSTTILEGFCIRLLDNVELNKILATATSHSAQQQQLNDDLLSIPIRTVAASQNKRRKMEDRTICIDEFHKVYDMKDAQKSSFYGVFDGHMGYPAAQYAASQLPFNLSTDAVASTNPIEALYRAFKYTDEKFISKGITSGTTAACTLYRPEEGRLYIAWVGDSKAMLAKQHGKIMQLVTPHRPELEREKVRIQSLGGSVLNVQGAYRVNGTLNVTRSIGDSIQKAFLISRPDCVLVDLDKQEEFLVMATDGLWDHASEIEVARTVYSCIKEDCENLDQIPSRLIKLAQDGNSSDNISVVVLFFKHPSQIAKNCDNLTIMESEFDNIKEVDYYNSRNFYPSDENATSNSHAIDAKQLRWSPNDNLNNIINEEVKQTTTTTTTTTITTNNGQFDDNLLYSSDNIDLNQKIPSPAGDDNNLHHASTLENNGEELLVAATGGYDNKNDELTTEFDNDQQKILAKNQNQTQQQLGDTDADYGPETCVDVTDDVVMMTENSADTNNLLEQSTLSHSKDTLPSSDNCNPFDNKNALDMEDANEFQLGSGALLQPDDANKSTPLLSPEMEDLPLSCEGGLQYTNEGFQQSPLDEEIPVGIDTHQEQQEQLKFEEEFLQSNGHLSPSEVVKSTDEEEKLDITQKKTEEEEDLESLAKLERFGDDIEEEKVKKEESNEKVSEENPLQQTDLDEVQLPVEPEIQQKDNIFDNTADDESDFRLTDEEEMQLPVEPEIQQKDNIFDNTANDESDFRLKDEEEILEKHVEAGFAEREQEPKESENEVLDLNQRNEVQQTLHNLEADVLEEKPILTGCYLEKSSPEGNFDDLSDEEKLSDFAEEKQDREEFSEKESKAEDDLEKAALPEQKATSIEEIELEEDECIHLEEDVRPSDYLAMLERQKQEREQLDKVVEGFEKEVQLIDGENENENENVLPKEEEQLISESPKPVVSEEPLELIEQESANTEELEIEKPSLEDDDRLSDKVEQFTKEQELEEIERLTEKLEEESDKLKEHVAEFEDEHFGEQKQPLFENEQVQQDNEKLSEQEELPHEELLVEDKSEEKLHEEPEVEEIENSELPRTDENLNIEPEPREQDRIELVSQLHQLDHREKEERTENRFIEEEEEEAAEQAPEVAEKQTEQIEKEEEDKQIEQLDEFEKEKETEKPQIEAHVDEKETETEKPEIEAHVDENILIEEARKSPVEDKESPLVEDSIAQPEKQWFEEPEKSAEEAIKEHEIDNLVLQQEEPIVEDKLPSELPIEESENKLCEEALEEPEKQLVECTEKQLAAIEALVMEPAPIRVKHLHSGRQLKYEGPGFEEPDPENLEEVQEEIIIKEQVPIKPSAPAEVTSQEPSAVPPTHESSNESEDDEWKYMKEGQGEKQLLGLQGDIVVEEEIQHQNLLLDSGADLIQEKLEPAASVLQEQISSVSLDIESIKHTFENLTQNIAELTESAAAATELTVDKIEDTLENINLSQSSTREKLDNIDDQDISASEMNSKLNPEAKEFIPNFSPTGNVDMSNGFNIAPLTVIPQHFKDEVLAQSPRKGRESNMEDINIPAENEFEEEIANKPHSLPSDEAIAEHAENGGVYEEMNWKEAMHGSEKEEGPLVDSPATDESIEAEEEIRYETGPIVGELEEICAPVDLENAGMKESIYIEHNITPEEEEDVLNTVQVLPVGEFESNDNSFISQNEIKAEPNPVRVEDAVTKEEVQEILALAVDDEKNENTAECETEQKMEQLLLNHDKEITKTVQLEPEQVPINGVEMSPASPEIAVAGELEYEPIPETELESEPEPIIEQVEEPSAPVEEPASSPVPIAEEAFEGLAIGAAAAAAAVAVAATTAAVKKVEAEKNQKNLSKTSSPATKPKVPDTKKPAGTTATTAKTSSLTAKRTLGEKPKPASSVATKKTVGSTTTAPRPRTAPAAGGAKTPTEKKTTTSTTTSAVKSRIDTKPPSTLASRKPLTSTAAKTSAAKPADSTTAKTASSKPSVASKTSTGSVRTSTTSSTTKPRPATASSAVTTNGTATKTATSKPTSLAPKSAGTTKSLTSPRGTLTSTLRKTEAIKSPIKTTLSSTTTSRTTNSTNGTKTTTSTRTTTTKTSSAPTAAARTTTTTTTRRPVTGTPSSGGTTPTSKSNSLVSRKSTPLKKTTTSSSSTPTARKSIGSKLNASATKATKENAIARPAPITAPIPQKNNDSIINEEPKDAILLSNDVASSRPPIVDNGEPKLNGIASPDDVTSSAVPLGMEVA